MQEMTTKDYNAMVDTLLVKASSIKEELESMKIEEELIIEVDPEVSMEIAAWQKDMEEVLGQIQGSVMDAHKVFTEVFTGDEECDCGCDHAHGHDEEE
jgi:hypothetical protein